MHNKETISWNTIDDLLGQSVEREFEITDDVIDQFAQLSGDTSEIHMSDELAQGRGFKARVMHGVLQASFVSAMIGTQLPGHRSLLQSLEMKYLHPCYVGDKITIKLKITDVHESVKTVIAMISIVNGKNKVMTKGKAQIGIT